jgi:hypothetical protein
MKIRYRNEFEDMRAFWQHLMSTNAAIKRQRLVALLFMVVIFAAIAVFAGRRAGSLSPALVVVAFGALFLVLFWRNSGRISDRRLRQMCPEEENRGVLCEHTIELTDDGVLETSPTGQTTTNWDGIVRVAETDDYVFLYITTNMAHVIPRNRLIEGDLDAFVAELKQH